MNHWFFIIRALVSITAVLILGWHMMMTDAVESKARKLRYLALFAGGLGVTWISWIQEREGAPVQKRHIALTVFVILLLAAAVASVLHDRKVQRTRQNEKRK